MKKTGTILCIMVVLLFVLCGCGECAHEYSETITQNPSCIEVGIKTFVCNICDESYTEEIPIVDHIYNAATCTDPETCKTCGATEGTAKGHNWEKATCLTPKTCKVCGTTEGDAKGHNWESATCISPKTCTVCKMLEGKPLDHTFGEWQVETQATVLDVGNKARYCNVCNNKESKQYQLSSYISNKRFIFTPKEYRKVFFDNFIELEYSKFGGAQIRTNDGQVVVSIIDNVYNNVGNIGFVVNADMLKMASSASERDFEGVVMMISAKTEFVANAIMCFIMSCDPTVNKNIAKEVATYILEGDFEFGGIKYSLTVSGNYYMLIAVVTS